jgi:hypothetical protein
MLPFIQPKPTLHAPNVMQITAAPESGSGRYASKKGKTMHLHKTFLLSMVAVFCLGWPAFSQVNGVEVAGGATAQVFGGKESVVKVIDTEGTEVASIPIEKDPGRFVYSEFSNTLYIIHNEKKDEHFISVVNLTTYHVDKQIKVGSGEAVDLMVSGDGRRVYCYTAVKGPTTNGMSMIYNKGVAYYSSKTLIPPFKPTVDVIDTASNEVIAAYDWLDRYSASASKDKWFSANQLIAASDQGVFVTEYTAFYRKPIDEKFIIFTGLTPQPAFMIDAGGRVVASMLSKDQKFLYAAIDGEKNTSGSLSVVELEKGTSVMHTLSDQPKRIFRLGANGEPWILGSEEMRAFSETGELTDRRIPLNKPTKSESGGETGASVFLEGYPGETISLGNDHAAIQIVNKHGGSQHKVALIDIKKLQVDAIIPTMSASEVSGIRIGRFAAAYAMSLGTGGTVTFIPNFTRNESLAASTDGHLLFALDLEGHVITVVDVQNAAVVKRIPVNNTVTKLQISVDKKYLICFGKKTQQINLATNNLEN